MSNPKPITVSNTYMTLRDGTVVPFYSVSDLGLATQTVTYHVDEETCKRWNDEMMQNIARSMADYYKQNLNDTK